MKNQTQKKGESLNVNRTNLKGDGAGTVAGQPNSRLFFLCFNIYCSYGLKYPYFYHIPGHLMDDRKVTTKFEAAKCVLG